MRNHQMENNSAVSLSLHHIHMLYVASVLIVGFVALAFQPVSPSVKFGTAATICERVGNRRSGER